jgi:lipid-A-disaccharide synthase
VREILVVAGEASGDLHAAPVVAALAARRPARPIVAVGGDRTAAAGATLLRHVRELSAMGFVEVLRHLPAHARLLRELRERFARGETGLVILVDYPGFNLRVAAAARAARIPVLYYITPQVWAWRAGRLRTMREVITRAAVILPFEEPLLREAGIAATYVGHPLLDHAGGLPSRADARALLGLRDDVPVLALFPGSRAGELGRHLDVMVAAAQRLAREVAGLQVVVAGAPGMTLEAARCPFPVVRERSLAVYAAADAALSKSGTNTLEAALAGCPLVVGYRTGGLNYAIAKRVVRIPHVSLVNIVARRAVVPELLQDAMTPDAFAAAARPLLDPTAPERRAMLEGLAAVRAALGEPGAAARVAAMAEAMLGTAA